MQYIAYYIIKAPPCQEGTVKNRIKHKALCGIVLSWDPLKTPYIISGSFEITFAVNF